MDIRETEKNGFAPEFGSRQLLLMRIWHWADFVLIFGALTTVLFAKVIFNPRANTAVVKGVLQKSNVVVTDDVAKNVVHEFSDHIWEWHTVIGYIIAGFLALRIVVRFFQPADHRIIPAIKNALRYLKIPSIKKEETKHFLFVKYMYLLFYFALFIQVCTGLFMAYSDDVPGLKSQRHLASNIHSVIMWVIIGFTLLHIAGVVRAELNKKTRGLVSAMINGGDSN